MAYCSELPYGILSYSNYIDLEKMRAVSSVVEKNEYRLLVTTYKKNGSCFKAIRNAFIYGVFKNFKRKKYIF